MPVYYKAPWIYTIIYEELDVMFYLPRLLNLTASVSTAQEVGKMAIERKMPLCLLSKESMNNWDPRGKNRAEKLIIYRLTEN